MCKEKWIVPSLSVEGINFSTNRKSIDRKRRGRCNFYTDSCQPITTKEKQRSSNHNSRYWEVVCWQERWLLGEQDRGSQKSQHRSPRRTVVTDIGYDVFFWKGLGSHPSGFSARCTRSTENTDQKVSIVNPGSLLANACYARAAIC